MVSLEMVEADIALTSLRINVNEMRQAVVVRVPKVTETTAGSGGHTPMLMTRKSMALKT